MRRNIEACGGVDGPQQALGLTGKLGTLVALSSNEDKALVNWNLVGDQQELTIRGSHLGPHFYPQAIKAVAQGQIDVGSLDTAQYSLDQFEQAIDSAMRGEGIKTMVVPGG